MSWIRVFRKKLHATTACKLFLRGAPFDAFSSGNLSAGFMDRNVSLIEGAGLHLNAEARLYARVDQCVRGTLPP